MLRVSARAAFLLAVSAVLALGVNAVSPHGIPLRPMTHPTDRPPRNHGALTDGYITLEMVKEASQFGLATLVDGRTAKEYEEGHIPGAINIPVRDFLKGRPPQLDRLDPKGVIIVYCEDPNCGTSVIVAEQLRLYGLRSKHGFEPDNVRVFTGGYPEWQKVGLEVAYGK